MDKKFTIQTAPVLVDATRVPTLYRIDFTVEAEVANVEIAYDALEPKVVTFGIAGNYTATAGLYDQDGKLMGNVAVVDFTIEIPGETREVNAVSGLSVENA